MNTSLAMEKYKKNNGTSFALEHIKNKLRTLLLR